MYLQAGSILQKIDYQLFKMKPQKIVIAIDSFKGCLTSAEAGAYIITFQLGNQHFSIFS